MNKILLNSEQEYMNLFLADENNLAEWEIESLLDIEFALEDGTYPKDWIKGIAINEDQELDITVYRKCESSIFPESYPCVMVYFIENSFDKLGAVKFRMFDFVYESDFKCTQS